MKEFMTGVRDRALIGSGIAGILLAGSMFLAGGANADDATDTAVTSTFTDLGTKIALYGGLLITLIAAGVALGFGIRFLLKGKKGAAAV